MFKFVSLHKKAMATSKCFVATLPNMTDEQFEKLFAWATNFCERFDFVKDQSGCIRMLVQKNSQTHNVHSSETYEPI